MKSIPKYIMIFLVVIFSTINVNAQIDALTGSKPPTKEIQASEKTTNADQGIINTLLIPISKFLTFLSIPIGIFISLRQYRLGLMGSGTNSLSLFCPG